MIKGINLIENIGQFEHVANVPFGKLTLIYGDNGRGKTTLGRVDGFG
jgi:DNA repair exonuclease SbcCD ATPase subunit